MLNLLPAEYKNRFRAQSAVYGLSLTYFIIAVVVVLGAAVLATLNLTQTVRNSDIQGQIDELKNQKQRSREIALQASFLEDRLAQAATYQETSRWDKVLDQVANVTPTDVRLTSLKVDINTTKGGTLNIAGETADRRSIVLFKDKLISQKELTGVILQSITETKATSGKMFTFTIQAGIKPSDGQK